MNKPYIVCHMVQSIDGRIDCHMVDKISGDEYYETLGKMKAKSFLNGRVTMAKYWAEKGAFEGKTPVGKAESWVAEKAEAYAFSVDTKGTLKWKSNRVEELPLVCIVSEAATKEYLEYLKAKKIGYIVCGKKGVDLKKAMAIAADKFGVKRLALLGGGVINGAFLKAGLIDEYSILLAPGIDARSGRVASFDGLPDVNRAPYKLMLTSCKAMKNGVVWLRYKKG